MVGEKKNGVHIMCDNIYMEDKIFNLLTFKGKTIFS